MGLVIGLTLPTAGRAEHWPSGRGRGDPFAPDVFVRIGPDDIVTVISKHVEIGQGPFTGLATLVAEELDDGWARCGSSMRPPTGALYGPLGIQGTGGIDCHSQCL